jgi:hypothetical protein
MEKQKRQGDLFISPIGSLPRGLKRRNEPVLAYGEVTGHKHQLVGDTSVVYEDVDGDVFFEVLSDTPLDHEEHDTLTIEIGKYKVIRKREYSPSANRQVLD